MKVLRQDGYLLPMVIMILLVSFIVGFATLNIGLFERNHANRRLDREAAFYLAEAGLQRACAHLQADFNWQPEPGPLPLGVGSFEVTRQDTGQVITLVSTGSVRNQQERIELNLEASDGLLAGGSFGDGLFGSEWVRIGNNAYIDSYDSRLGPYSLTNRGSDGDVSSNILIEVGNNAEVLGDADVPSTGSITGETYITGQKDYDADVKTPNPVVIPPALIALPYPVTGDPRISEATVAAGVLTVANNKTATLAAGNYHFKGINVRNNAILRMEGSVIIYVEQDITLNQGASLRLGQPTYSMVFYVGPDGIIDLEQNSAVNIPLTTRPTQARFYVAGTGTEIITSVLSAQVAIFNGLIYAPERRATIEENVDFYGGLVVRELSIDNNASIHYDASLREPPGFPEDPGTVIPAGLKLLNWTKPGWRERLL